VSRSFEDVVLLHLDEAFNDARWLTKNDADAEDVAQDACVRALRSVEQFPFPVLRLDRSVAHNRR
jgi:RNA polymerase sigma-70 factor (ECF subfamily)